MVIPINPKATAGGLAPRRTFRGRMAANRQLRGVAIVAALAVVLAATLTGNWALQADRAGDTAPLPAVAVAETSGSTAAVGDTTVAGLREFLNGEGVTGANRTSGIAAETGRQEFLAGDGSTRSLPSLIPNRETVPGFTSYREDHRLPVTTAARQQAELYGIEVRDNGAGTTGGDSSPCRNPGNPCNR
jgi:hypothetical protein